MISSDLFERQNYKKAAKSRLKGSWKVPVLVTLIVAVITGLVSSSSELTCTSDYQSYSWSALINGSLSLISIIITGILGIALSNFYLSMDKKNTIAFNDFFDGFILWGKGIISALWTVLWTFLWSLLFLFPGLIKFIAYSQMNFILVEYPNVTVPEAMKISMKITKGYKCDLFTMYLSFIGWAFLSVLSCGIGFFWLFPYVKLTSVKAYHFLMENAFNKGRITMAELTKETTNSETENKEEI